MLILMVIIWLFRINNPEDLMKNGFHWDLMCLKYGTHKGSGFLVDIIFAPGLKPLWPATR